MVSRATVKKQSDRQVKQAIVEALQNLNLAETEWWDSLEQLSQQTIFESIEVFEDEITIDSRTKRFKGNINVYVTLNYGGDEDPVSMSDAYPGTFGGTLVDGKPNFENIDIDTSSFYQ